ncbi:TetR/AcrR family transcriptional regulator [Mycobacteroides abscessus]|uniref:TetR/AcrR family transcriptional regulator n=1 Tax=Mycobacteroides abscessus TaxID=36809 RepID=UPI00266C777F|nr:TetR family transcriptional regulator [Mycobacteroides abscessus]MDO3213906.1 TetR family transcriptional regulator [Mycobacteroides abscessus subsp. abscessus]
MNLDAVAREAGCSRATVYRHVGGKTAIVDAVLARNIAKVTADIQRAVQSADARRRAVVAITASLTAIRHPPRPRHQHDDRDHVAHLARVLSERIVRNPAFGVRIHRACR